MARTINEILTAKMQSLAADATLGPMLTSTSKVAVYRLLLYISAVHDFVLENLHDLFRKEVAETIAAMKPHSLQWYALKSKAFQYGFNLVADADYYNNAGISDADVADSLIVDHAAVVEQERGLRIKVATSTGTDLQALTPGQLAAFVGYMKRIKDAGVKLAITTGPADDLKLSLRIKYNPLVLNGAGGRIDGISAEPVKEAIKYFLKNLPFNGVFSVQKLVDAVQAVEGVSDVSVDLVQSRYGALDFTSVDIDLTPDSGYLRVADADLLLQFIAA